MPIFHVVHTRPLCTSHLKPGERLITLSDIPGRGSQLFLVEENTSDEDTYYGSDLAPLLSRIGEIALADMDEDILDELKAARFRLNVNHIGPIELSDTDAEKILRLYAAQSPTTVAQSPTTIASKLLSPVKSTSGSLNIFHLMYDTDQNAGPNKHAVDKPLSPRFF